MIVVSSPNGSWEVVPTSMLAGIGLIAKCVYFLYRGVMAMLAITDAYSGVPMKPPWSFRRCIEPSARRRLNKAIAHCVVAGILLAIYLDIGDYFGWLEFIDQ